VRVRNVDMEFVRSVWLEEMRKEGYSVVDVQGRRT